jgi:cellulose biosynthesis protein BcsQ
MQTRSNTRIIAAWTSKANVGKTTFLVLLAWYYSHVEKKRVKIWDADPSHESMSRWMDTLSDLRRQAIDDPDTTDQDIPSDIPFDYDSCPSQRIARKVTEDMNDYDIVLIDVGGGHEKIATAATEIADLFIVVTSDSWMETTTLETALTTLRDGAKKHRPATGTDMELAVLMSRVPPNATRMVEKLATYFTGDETLNVDVFEAFFPQRVDYKRVAGRHIDEVGIHLEADEDGTPSEVGAIASEINELIEVP